MTNFPETKSPALGDSGDAKARSRQKTSEEIQRAIAGLQSTQSKISISAVAKATGVSPALIHNTYPDIAEQIRCLVGKATRTTRDAKHEALTRERKINRALRSEINILRSDLAKLASINQTLLYEISILKGIASGKVVALLHPRQPEI